MIPSSDCLQWSSDQPGPARKRRVQGRLPQSAGHNPRQTRSARSRSNKIRNCPPTQRLNGSTTVAKTSFRSGSSLRFGLAERREAGRKSVPFLHAFAHLRVLRAPPKSRIGLLISPSRRLLTLAPGRFGCTSHAASGNTILAPG